MKPFSKKIDLTLLILSLFAAAVGTVLVSMSGSLLYWIYDVLQTKVFHREFSLEKWASTIGALITFPIFFGIFFDALFFVKFSDRSKIILLCTYFAIAVFFLALCAALKSDAFMDSDMASDLLLGNECWRQKTFWPRSWYYSTEIRLLNMQIFSAPVFAFTSNWHIVKTVSSVLLSLVLPLAMWFVLTQLKIEPGWLKALMCLCILCPWSFTSWKCIQFGSYYVTLVASTYFYAGLCISLMYNENLDKKERLFKALFYACSFLCGLSSIRYILQLHFPMVLVAFSIAITKLFKVKKEFNVKSFFIEDKAVFYPVFGLVLGCLGFLCNSLVLSRIYKFADFGTMGFNSFNEVPVMRWIFDILCCLGYRDRVAVFTPAGAINVFVYALVAFFVICAVQIIAEKQVDQKRRVFVLFSIVMFVFNAFVFINTDYYTRYILILLLCIFPCTAIFLVEERIFVLKRYILGVLTATVLLSSSFITFSGVLSKTDNEGQIKVAAFLKDSGFTFGYATFWNANTITFFTDGKVEVANLDNERFDGAYHLLNEFRCDYWLTPRRYYESSYKSAEKVFLLVNEEEFADSPNNNMFKAGKKIYDDSGYLVFEYENRSAFENCF